jgi:hypothetical protein
MDDVIALTKRWTNALCYIGVPNSLIMSSSAPRGLQRAAAIIHSDNK